MNSRAFLSGFLAAWCAVAAGLGSARAATLQQTFKTPPDACRPGVYWYFMDGNLSREGMTRDLESMKAAGLGHVVFLEVNVGVPRGSVDFLSDAWQELFVHAVREAERLGLEITLGSGPGWAGSGGPWVRGAQSMQHLVASQTNAQGPGRFRAALPVPAPRRPFFGDVPESMRAEWAAFYRDVAVLAFPAPSAPGTIQDLDEKSLVYRAPYSSQPGVKPRLEAPADHALLPAGAVVRGAGVLDLTDKLGPDGVLDWEMPAGPWTILRFVSRNNGASTRPAPAPGEGFECDKLDASALDAHFERYAGRLLERVGARARGRGWTMLHIDSWEMGAQNWTPRLREAFRRRRGYDPQPYYPVMAGFPVESLEVSERFLWDLRRTAGEMVIENHAERLKALGRRYGMGLSIEPYDMNPSNDFDLGAVADVPMCEFWSVGFNTTYSCQQASSIAHVMGCAVVAAEAFTGAPGEDWTLYPGALKNQGDWAFGTGINRLTYHTFAHKPDETRPGMVMGPYGVHWDRGQTWWPMVRPYHEYVARCQHLLRQGRAVADILYVMPEGAPNVFTPPASAFSGSAELPDRRGYNFDGCSARVLQDRARVRAGRVEFPGGASYRLVVLPRVETMTPAMVGSVMSLVKAGATVVGPPPRKSPSLEGYPRCDEQVERMATALWGAVRPGEGPLSRRVGKGRVLWGGDLASTQSAGDSLYPAYEATAAVLEGMGVPLDFEGGESLRYAHRTSPEREVYFVANRTSAAVAIEAGFRAVGVVTELWDPLSGEIELASGVVVRDGRSWVPLRLASHGSVFVVFPRRESARSPGAAAGMQGLDGECGVEGPWDVSFDPGMGAPARVRFEHLVDWATREEPGIRYYAGIGVYRRALEVPGDWVGRGGRSLWLELGEVHALARVRVNGEDCGVVWTAPWRVDISRAVRLGTNTLEVEVANLWPNRMIGDAREPGVVRAQTTYRPYKGQEPLLASGLLGPVRLVRRAVAERAQNGPVPAN